jgi:hypothetical protein
MAQMANGTKQCDGVPLLRGKTLLGYDQAQKVLQTGYNHRDGVDVETLLDSKTHGALAYNDFLVLPGYIGTETLQ